MRTKKITSAVLDANRANAKKPRGERSVAGRLAARRNPLKHGLFARELILSEGEQDEVQTLRRELRAQLLPTTVLQKVAFEGVVCSIWRVKLAVRLEMRQVSRLLERSGGEEIPPGATDGASAVPSWYSSSRQGLRDGIRFIEDLINDFESGGSINEDLKVSIESGFGAEFYDLLTKWTPMSYDGVLLANHLYKQARLYNKPLPPLPDGAREVIIDPDQGRQMTRKLLEQKLQELRNLSKSWEQRMVLTVEAHNATVDFSARYFTQATRDFHRAVDYFQQLKKCNL